MALRGASLALRASVAFVFHEFRFKDLVGLKQPIIRGGLGCT